MKLQRLLAYSDYIKVAIVFKSHSFPSNIHHLLQINSLKDLNMTTWLLFVNKMLPSLLGYFLSLFLSYSPASFYCVQALHRTELSSTECSSMVSVAAFDPQDPGSNPGWFAVSNSNRKWSFHK